MGRTGFVACDDRGIQQIADVVVAPAPAGRREGREAASDAQRPIQIAESASGGRGTNAPGSSEFTRRWDVASGGRDAPHLSLSADSELLRIHSLFWGSSTHEELGCKLNLRG